MELVQIGDNALTLEQTKEFVQVLTHNLRGPYGVLELMLGVKKIKTFENTIVFDIHSDLSEISNVHTVHMIYNVGADLYELKFFNKHGKLLKHFTNLFFDMVKEVFENYTNLSLTVPCLKI